MGRHEEALKILHGGTVIPAIPLVLDENRKFNEAGTRTLIRYYLDAGVGGLAVAVHTTQFEIRKPEVGLFEPVLRVTKEEMDAYEARTGKTLVRVAGACGEAEQACAEARTAKALGFDAVLLSPGGLAHRTEEELVERTHAVAAEMPVIGFYLQTACGGRRLSYEYWKAVADAPAWWPSNALRSTGTRASTWCGAWRTARGGRKLRCTRATTTTSWRTF